MTSAGETAVRPAVPGDIEAIVALDRGIDNLPHWAAAEYLAYFVEGDSQLLRCLLVAESQGGIVGLAGSVVHSVAGACWAELETLGVAPAMQRRGLGRELCRAVIAWCRSLGAAHLDLEVRSRNAGPLALYRELGFESAGQRPAYYRAPADDAVLMRLDLKREQAQAPAITEPAG